MKGVHKNGSQATDGTAFISVLGFPVCSSQEAATIVIWIFKKSVLTYRKSLLRDESLPPSVSLERLGVRKATGRLRNHWRLL